MSGSKIGKVLTLITRFFHEYSLKYAIPTPTHNYFNAVLCPVQHRANKFLCTCTVEEYFVLFLTVQLCVDHDVATLCYKVNLF